MMASLSGNLATMGPGVPYAIAAKFAYPDRAVIAMVGDGAMQMNGMNGLITIGKYWKRWADPRLIVLCSTTAT
jgi:pyruvate dehydrogenase (quinone)